MPVGVLWWQANGGQLDMEVPLINVAAFMQFAVHRYHYTKDESAVVPSPPKKDVSKVPVDNFTAQNEISSAVITLRREVRSAETPSSVAWV